MGPSPSPICLVGEAPGDTEALYGRPFIGESGQELTRMLADAGLDRSTMYVTNVFKQHPPRNDLGFFFTSRTDPDACTDLPANGKGKYLRAEFRPMVDDLLRELDDVGAQVVVALGATALWALLGYSKISPYVGTVHPPSGKRRFSVIPTFHPSMVIRNWSYRTTVVGNLLKVKDQPIRRLGSTAVPARAPSPNGLRVKVNPTLAECLAFTSRAVKAPEMGIDIETAHGQIRTISFAIAADYAFTIPFWEPPADSYWPTVAGEIAAWNCVRRILACPATKIFQLGTYDIQYLWRVHGIVVRGPIEDTGLAHHALEPELPKTLGYMAASYLDIPEWKTMRGLRSEKEEE